MLRRCFSRFLCLLVSLFALLACSPLLQLVSSQSTFYPNAFYLGCIDDASGSLLTQFYPSSSYLSKCGNSTRLNGQELFALSQGSYCSGEPNINFLQLNKLKFVPAANCNTPCIAEPTELCGGSPYWSLWRHNFGPVVFSIDPPLLSTQPAANTAVTLTGYNFVTVPAVAPLVTFTDLIANGTTGTSRSCNVRAGYNDTQIVCDLPVGQGYSIVSVKLGSLSLVPLPRFPNDFYFWADANRLSQTPNCVRVPNDIDPEPAHTWFDNSFCSNAGTASLRFVWSQTGPLNNSDYSCLNWHSRSREPVVWSNTYLCWPRRIPYSFSWSENGLIAGKSCLTIFEPNCPGFLQGLNNICADPNQPLAITAPSGIDSRFKYQYSPPVIVSVSPLNGPVSGGTQLVIAGSSFGFLTGSPLFTINGVACPIVTATYSHTGFTCTLPPGEGSNNDLILSVAGLSSTGTMKFNYDPPSITNITPLVGSTNGLTPVSITGVNFGLTKGQVWFDGVRLSSAAVTWGNTLVTFNAPIGRGVNKTISLFSFPFGDPRSQQATVTRQYLFNYIPPSVDSLIPSTNAPRTGAFLTITGANFGASGDIDSIVRVGGAFCTPSSWSHTLIQCQYPATSDDFAFVSLIIGGQENARLPVAFLYFADPQIISLIPPAGYLSIPSSDYPLGMTSSPTLLTSLTIVGVNFGNGTNNAIDSQDPNYNRSTLTIGGRLCSIQSNDWLDNRIICLLTGPFINSLWAFQVPVQVSVSGRLSNISPFSFAPTIQSIFSPAGFPTAGGSLVTIQGSNFILVSQLAQFGLNYSMGVAVKSFINQTYQFVYQLPIQSYSINAATQTINNITFYLPPGQGIGNCIYVRLGNLTSFCSKFDYNGPVITAMTPVVGPAGGGFLLSLWGSNFGFQTQLRAIGAVSLPSIFINNLPCPVFYQNHTFLTCTVQSGAGVNLPVQISLNAAQRTNSPVLFSYNAPVLDSLDPPISPGSGAAVNLTLIGQNFFSASCGINFNNVLYSSLPLNSSAIKLPLPAGAGAVPVYVVCGGIPSNILTFLYSPPVITSVSPIAADSSGGIPFTINGANFVSNVQILVGGSICPQDDTLGVNTATLVRCLLPEGSGRNQNVSVQIGNVVSNSWPFNYNPPRITSFTPVNGPTNGNNIIVINGQSFGPTGSVSIGGQNCVPQGGSYSHTSISCRIPPGPAAGQIHQSDVRVNSNGQSGNASTRFVYDSPAVNLVNPATATTDGLTSLIIQGVNFGLNGSVTIGGQTCVIDGAVTHNSITCLAPSMTGVNLPLIVRVNFLQTQFLYSFTAPTFINISATNGSTSGGEWINLFGLNVGAIVNPLNSVRVSIDGRSVSNLIISPSLLRFQSPVGSGINKIIVADINGQTVPNLPRFSYNPPTISSATSSDCAPDLVNPGSLVNCPVAGAQLTIAGANLNGINSFINVYLQTATIPINCTVVSVNHVSVVCVLQPRPEGGSRMSLFAVVDGQTTNTVPLISFTGPVITPRTIVVANLLSSGSGVVSTNLPDGSRSITFNSSAGAPTAERRISLGGSGFGSVVGVVTVKYDYISPTQLLSIGAFNDALFSYMAYQCSVTTVVDSLVTCDLSEIVGKNLTFIVRVGLLYSSLSADSINSPAAFLIPNSISLVDLSGRRTTMTNSVVGTSSLGDLIDFNVTNVGSLASRIKVSYFQPGNLATTKSCDVSLISTGIRFDSGGYQYIRCKTAPGVGANYVFQITTNSLLISNPGTDYYSYTEPPIVYRVSGIRDFGNATFDLPTKGGIILSLYGSKFSANGLTVLIGDTPCISPNLVSQSFLTCIAPPATGINLAVSVTVGTKISPFINAVSYSTASVGSISGCAAGASDCNRLGGVRITLAGQNFGPAAPRPAPTVIVGGKICPAPRVLDVDHTMVDCLLPSGTQRSQPVLFVQGRGPVTISNATVDYSQCAAGSFASPSNLTCSVCSAGRFTPTSGMSDCLFCPGGTFSSANATSCLFCPTGKYSIFDNSGTAVCIDCDLGTYALAPGSSICSPCAAGRFAASKATVNCQDCAPGNYSLDTGSSACQLCNPGTYTASSGASQCLQCSAGSISSSGKSSCQLCNSGSVSNSQFTACVPCNAGSYAPFSPSERCDPCPAGRFSSSGGASNCSLCASGSSTDGISGRQSCNACGFGKFTSGNGEASCVDCPQGSFASSGSSSSCLPCIPGSYSDVISSRNCLPCGAGKYADFFGAIQCLLCNPGSYSVFNASTCSSCNPGTFSPYSGASICVDCPSGQTSGFRQPLCSDCGDGLFSVGGTSACLRCDAGSFSVAGSRTVSVETFTPSNPLDPLSRTDISIRVTGQSICTLCNSGEFASQTGSPNCQFCQPGNYAFGSGNKNCTACDAGSYSQSLKSDQCTSCEAGKFSSQPGAQQCDPCPQGFATTATGLTSCGVCAAGRFQPVANSPFGVTSCLNCNLGQFTDSPGQSACSFCAAGSYNNRTNSSACTLCENGRYQPSTGKSSCIPAPLGGFATGLGNTDYQLCLPGSFSNLTGFAICALCETGEFSSTGVSICSKCDVGYYSNIRGSPRCEPCAAGMYADSTGLSICRQCDPGFNQSSTAQSSCSSCYRGSYTSTYGALTCLDCGGGTYSNRQSATLCDVCNSGTFTPAVSGTATGPTSCQPCSAGSFASQPGQAGCTLCPIGKSAKLPGQSACTDCVPGKYANFEGSPICSDCDPGTVTFSNSSSLCIPCLAGQFQFFSGKTSCDICPLGSFQDRVGQSICTACFTGRYSNSNGSINCAFCDPGSYNAITGVSECSACLGGTFNANRGASVCQSCAAGTAAPDRALSCPSCNPGSYARSGFSSCVLCPAGFSESAIGSQQCKLCPRGTFAAEGATGCTPCSEGSIAANSGAGSCVPCTLPAVADPLRITCQCPIGTAAQPLYNSSATESNAFICVNCPNGADCNQPGLLLDSLRASQGWWRTPRISRQDPDYDLCRAAGYCGVGNELNNFPLFYRCLNYLYCNGGLNEQPWKSSQLVSEMSQTCSGNRVGPLCNLCKPGYIDSLGGMCVQCTQSDGQQALLVIIIVLLLSALCFMFYILLKSNEALFAMSYQRLVDSRNSAQIDSKTSPMSTYLTPDNPADISLFIDRQAKLQADNEALQRFYHSDLYDCLPDHVPHAKPNFTFKLKILIGFCQIVSNLAISLDIQWPAQFLQFISWLNPVNLDFVQVSNVGCLTEATHYKKLIIICIVPPVMLIGLFLFWYLPRRLLISNDPCKSTILRQKTSLFFLYLLFLLYPFTSSTVIKTFVCRKIGGTNYLVADMFSKCDTDEWDRYTQFASLMIIAYPVGIPCLFGLILFFNRNNLSSPIVRATYGFLFDAFTFQYYWFELADMLHKFVLTSILLLLPLGSQIPTGLAVAGFYMIVLLCSKPYLRKSDDRLHAFAQCELMLLFLSGYIFYTKVKFDEFYSILLSIVLIGLVCSFIGLFVIQSLSAWRRYRGGRDDWKKMTAGDKKRAASSAQKRLEEELELQELMNNKRTDDGPDSAPKLKVGIENTADPMTAEERQKRKNKRDKAAETFYSKANASNWMKNRDRVAALEATPTVPCDSNNNEFSAARPIAFSTSSATTAPGASPGFAPGEFQKRWQEHLHEDD